MKTPGNLALGLALAGLCLAPAAGSDAARLFAGGAVPQQSVGASHFLSPLEHAVLAARAAFPQLLAGASTRLVASPERR
jgi:hypothetical protein